MRCGFLLRENDDAMAMGRYAKKGTRGLPSSAAIVKSAKRIRLHIAPLPSMWAIVRFGARRKRSNRNYQHQDAAWGRRGSSCQVFRNNIKRTYIDYSDGSNRMCAALVPAAPRGESGYPRASAWTPASPSSDADDMDAIVGRVRTL